MLARRRSAHGRLGCAPVGVGWISPSLAGDGRRDEMLARYGGGVRVFDATVGYVVDLEDSAGDGMSGTPGLSAGRWVGPCTTRPPPPPPPGHHQAQLSSRRAARRCAAKLSRLPEPEDVPNAVISCPVRADSVSATAICGAAFARDESCGVGCRMCGAVGGLDRHHRGILRTVTWILKKCRVSKAFVESHFQCHLMCILTI